MSDKTSLGDRMKAYEYINRGYLTRRIPVIIRVDGRAFHTFTRGFQKPFDPIMQYCMLETAKALCTGIQGCKMAYTQSDEISLLLTDYATIQTDAWFGYNVQKIVSISASMATLAFNVAYNSCIDFGSENGFLYASKVYKAMFDSRCFTLPKEEVCNYLIWRQQDATRNAIQMVARSQFSDKKLFKKSCADINEMLFSQKGINFNDYPTYQKRGTAVVLTEDGWVVDKDMPILTQDRNYIEKLL